MPSPARDAFGFRFWLGWILWFAGSLVAAALFWTALAAAAFGKIRGPERTVTWSLAVFGTWFLLVIPFMRKKERIWKRLNCDQEKAADAWLLGMGIFIGLLIASAFFWSLRYASRSAVKSGGLDPLWTKSVAGTWLFLALPFLVLMYRKADRIFKSAAGRRTQAGPLRDSSRISNAGGAERIGAGPKFRTCFMEKEKRLLPGRLAQKLKNVPTPLPQGHVVTLRLKDGRLVPHVFVLNLSEILGVYGRTEPGFEAADIEDVEPVSEFPAYEEEKWLRLDGRT